MELVILRAAIELAMVGAMGWFGYRAYRKWRQQRSLPPPDEELIEWLNEHEHMHEGEHKSPRN